MDPENSAGGGGGGGGMTMYLLLFFPDIIVFHKGPYGPPFGPPVPLWIRPCVIDSISCEVSASDAKMVLV